VYIERCLDFLENREDGKAPRILARLSERRG
jgi:hypothetical protein